MSKIEFSKFINFIFIIYLICLLRLAVFRDSFSIFHIFEVGKYNLSFFSDLAEIYKNDKKIFLILFLFFSFLFSLLVESSQFIFKCGIFEIDDLILNTTGAVLGAIFISVLLN
ncbi:VanZ family protein [Campylobacter ureolyticus]|uniref:VanZ family protein n=1 Tax=Campylobacter ureolyticus TaxID=827 RepID=UPI0022B48522|nr:VanZ family protein [Campylobacter ureolyticus]MCZ6102992.1 VanZ family protein [Campylobacter ureolyticus]